MIRLTRSQSLVVAIGTLAVFFLIVGVVVREERKEIPSLSPQDRARLAIRDESARNTQQAGGVQQQGSSAQEQSLFVLDNFERSEVRDGRKTWEVKAREGHYMPGSSSALVKDAKLWVYQKDGDIVSIAAREATLYLNGTELTRAETRGDVVVMKNDDMTLTTDVAVFDKAANTVQAPGLVRIVTEAMDVEGVGMLVDVSGQEVKLLGNVSTLVKPKGG